MLTDDHFSKKYDVIYKNFLLLPWKFLSSLVCVPSLKTINGSLLYKKRCDFDGDKFTSTPHKRLRGQNLPVGISLIELTDPSDTLNYKPFLNIAF